MKTISFGFACRIPASICKTNWCTAPFTSWASTRSWALRRRKWAALTRTRFRSAASRDHYINFANLPDQGEVRIYTATTGELVKTIRIDPGHADPLPWNATNDGGQALGADVYTYQIKAGGNTKTGKLVIVR